MSRQTLKSLSRLCLALTAMAVFRSGTSPRLLAQSHAAITVSVTVVSAEASWEGQRLAHAVAARPRTSQALVSQSVTIMGRVASVRRAAPSATPAAQPEDKPAPVELVVEYPST
jgi:hypothetical protein